MKENLNSYILPEKEYELLFIQHIICKPDDSYLLDSSCIFTPLYNLIHRTIQKLIQEENIVSINSLYDACKHISDIEKNDIDKLFNEAKICNDINYILQKLRQFHFKNNIVIGIEKLFASSIDKQDLDSKNIESFISSIISDYNELNSNTSLLTFDDIVIQYKKILQERKDGILNRSLGFTELDQVITRPGAGGQMTGLVGMKGSGKSIFAKCVENLLINKKICVLSLNFEMPLESSMDRLIGIRSGITLEQLITKEKDRRIEQKIERELCRLEEIKNYCYYPDPDLSLAELPAVIKKAKNKFKAAGVLPDDEYIFIVFDLLDMMMDFDGADAYSIKKNMNKLHRILRKENCHGFLLLQANENKLRSGKVVKKPEEFDYYSIALEDIEGGSAYGARCRVVMSLNRPVQLKMQHFPERKEEWELEPDVINIHGIKQNEGKLFFKQFAFNENYRIYPYINKKSECRDTNITN